MHAINEKTPHTLPNGWGRTSTTYRQKFVIEQSDIGRNVPNHRGDGCPGYMVKAADVGRIITKYTDGSAWNCWTFD